MRETDEERKLSLAGTEDERHRAEKQAECREGPSGRN